jgi:hypothetical protein
LVVFAGDSVAQRSSITADGTLRAIDVDGCVGSERARFSDDGSRVFLEGTVRCNEGAEQHTSGVISISETGQWIDVHGVRVGDQRSLRVRRSRPAPSTVAPTAMRSRIDARALGDAGARVGAAKALTLDRVRETAVAVDERVAEAWLLESSRDGSVLTPVDARQLVQLESDGVPARVIDVLVALSYPGKFQVALTADGSGEVTRVAGAAEATMARGAMYPDAIAYSLYGSPRCYTYSCFVYYSDAPYMYGLAGWNSYGGWGLYPGWGMYPGWGYGGGGGTIIIRPSEPGGGGSPTGGGRVVKGRGYTGGGASGAPAQPRAQPVNTAGTSSTSSGSRAGSSSATTKSSGEKSAEPRTAKRRP